MNLFYPTSKYSVKKIMLPLYELMQLLYMAIGTRAQKKLYIMSGLNLRNFWEYAEQKFDFKFIKILIPMIGSLTRESASKSDDLDNCISLLSARNELLIKNGNLCVDSMVQHYQQIYFKNIEFFRSRLADGRSIHDGIWFQGDQECSGFLFKTFEEFYVYLSKLSSEEQRRFIEKNFLNHTEVFIEYVNSKLK